MRNYISFGGGVNSVAMMLYLYSEDPGRTDFESVFVDHGTDYPMTYDYLEMFQKYLKDEGYPPITVIRPKEKNLYDYCFEHRMVPSIHPRWCTRQFKIKPLFDYYKKPCFQMIGIDAGESKRARISVEDGVENRYPLIELNINREECSQLIKWHNIPIPPKSGCFICPYQTPYQWRELRFNHPDLFCRAEQLEKRNMEYRISKGKKPMYLSPRKASLRAVVEETQAQIFEQDEYPPCQCGL